MVGAIKPFSKQAEENVRNYWRENSIVEKVRKKSSVGKEKFYFMDGPPYATGHIHMGTGLNKIMKDCAIRSQRMQGKKIFDRPGFDTHGLPIENKVEKKLGFKTKKDIEDFGVENFVKECRAFATEFIDTMGKEFADLGDWMDYSNPYLTLSNDYIEAIWFAFKKADEKGLLYLGKYPVHVCPHCATAVAFNEIEYEKVVDKAIFVKLELVDEPNTFLLIWTTTPWTLPANTGVMVHPNYDYAFVSLSNGEKLIIAKEKVEELMSAFEVGYSIEKIVKGKELEGLKYKPLYDGVVPKEEEKNAFRVILSDRYVNLSDGSGLVHTAPGHGKEDYDAGTRAGLPIVSPVNIDGTFTQEVKLYAGRKAKEANDDIIEELKEKGLVVYVHNYSHDYPLCWRCSSPLLMISTPQWFLRVSQIRNEMVALNSNVNWVPYWMHDRMKNWLENLSDWPVSRQRYWGAPLPIWICSCGERKVIGSIEELKREANLSQEPDLHKPYIDEIKLKCSKCKGEMSRVPEVLDVWFDSGVSSWANLGYPKDDKLFKEFWPADLNIEMTEQVRGWWNSQAILSTICFGEFPFKAVSVHGMVRDLGHQKMSKSKGNIITPQQMIEAYNRDYLRFYLLSQSKGIDFNFDSKGVAEVGKFFNTLNNSLNYAKMYLNIDLNSSARNDLLEEDKWLLSRLEYFSNEMISAYNSYEFSKTVSLLQEFVDVDFSRTYLKLIRERIGTETQPQVDCTVSIVIDSLLRLLAPICPHAAEHFYLQFSNKNLPESVHLLDFKKISGFRDEKLEEEFSFVETIVQNVLALRVENKLRLRWKISSIAIDSTKKISKLEDALKRMCNCEKVIQGKLPNNFASRDFGKGVVGISIEANDLLKEEWELSELLRNIQDARKKAGLIPGQIVSLNIFCSDKNFLEKYKNQIQEKTSTKLNVLSSSPKETQTFVERSFYFELLK